MSTLSPRLSPAPPRSPLSYSNSDSLTDPQIVPEPSLQDSFQQFRDKKIRERQLLRRQERSEPRSEVEIEALRRCFVDIAKRYLGVPYSEKYKNPEDPVAPIYLDCCGLVRQVLLDMREELGFVVGRWNQCYQIDTLPIVVEDIAQMKPGDLIFYEGSYVSERSKPQKHDMVHVEIFLGGQTGEETIGARNQRGGVDIFPSYKFTSKNWTLTKFHFRSIDTWLQGQCKSCCPEHAWSTDDIKLRGAVGKKSIFYADSDNESSGDHDPDDNIDLCEASSSAETQPNDPVLEQPSAPSSQKIARPRRQASQSPTATLSPTSSTGIYKQTSSSSAKVKSASAPAPKTFYVGKSNGWKLVVDALVQRGWQQLPFEYNFSSRFGLKWVERRSQIDYKAHQPGQLVNHIPNNDCITTKINLHRTLRDYFFMNPPSINNNASPSTVIDPKVPWLPVTYQLDTPSDCLAAIAAETQWKEQRGSDGVWIYKPPCNNRGRGIRVLSGIESLREVCFSQTSSDEEQGTTSRSQSVVGLPTSTSSLKGVIQKYIEQPMLVGKERLKYDIRCYLLIACTHPKTKAYYHKGYCRLSLKPYSLDKASFDDPTVHLTNAAIQKQGDSYSQNKEKQIQLPEAIARIIEEDGNAAGAEYLRHQLDNDIKRCLVDVMKASNKILQKKHGYFDLLGCDFMVTDSNELVLLEINTNPALSLDNSTLEALLPGVVDDTIDLVLKLQTPSDKASSRSASSNRLLDDSALPRQNGFELIYDEADGYCFVQNNAKAPSKE